MRRVLALLIAAIFAIAAPSASAYWPAFGVGTGTATSGQLDPGAQPTTTVSGSTVTVQWAQTVFLGSPLGGYTGGGYNVKRYPAAGGAGVTPAGTCGTFISGSATPLSCQETAVPPGSWQYAITPVLSTWQGAESSLSVSAAVNPSAPVLNSVVAQNPSADIAVGDVVVNWSTVSGATGYDIFRRTSSGTFDFNAPINGSTPVTALTYTDSGSGLSATSYDYVVRARTGSLSSASSNQLSVTTVARPSAPSSLTATATAAANIQLSWPAVAGATGYKIFRRLTAGAYNFTSPLNGTTAVTGTTFTDATSVSGQIYFYVVRAIKPGSGGVEVESFSSPEASATADGSTPSTVTVTDPGSPLRGSITLSGTASDAGSGIATVQFQSSPAGSATWSDICTATVSPYSCAMNTASLTDGLYDLRAVATDVAGNVGTSVTVANRRIDNTAPAVTLNDPGAFLRQTVSVSATAVETGSGISSFAISYAPTGTTTWTTLCTTATTAATCSWNTTLVAQQGYDLRAVATDLAGNISTSTITNRVVDNTAPNGVDIQTVNSGTAAKPETGDQIIYTFSEPVLPSSILAGWTGSSLAVNVTFVNGNPDVVRIWNAAGTVEANLGQVRSGKKYVTADVSFSGSTMAISGNAITVTLGVPSGTTQTAVGATTLSWITSTGATDRAGNPLVAATIMETGLLDADF